MIIKLDNFEQEMEDNIDNFTQIGAAKKTVIENIIDKANEKRSISIRLKNSDLYQLKLRADTEGLPYQTLLSSIVHKFVTDQLVDKKSIIKGIEILQSSK
jgi:predicted DNA binding CopG/RHH family protein